MNRTPQAESFKKVKLFWNGAFVGSPGSNIFERNGPD
jgi:hypothetical protein